MKVYILRKLIYNISQTDSNVLILGESGTGKERVAKNIHYNSSRKDMPFIALNCNAIPSNLLESELFGYEKGAFTGALNNHKGRFELAQNGTLFLDEIGDIPINMQVKLLRVLQEKKIQRIGGNDTINLNVRIITATNKNLEQLIVDRKFREDLYYRINVFPIYMPALRDRGNDIILLIKDIIRNMQSSYVDFFSFSYCAIVSLMKYNWPGNIRELSNLTERLQILYPGEIITYDKLPLKYQIGDVSQDNIIELNKNKNKNKNKIPITGINLKLLLEEIELEMITKALLINDDNITKSALMLGMKRSTLSFKIKRYHNP